jgi:hypothetical protein
MRISEGALLICYFNGHTSNRNVKFESFYVDRSN